jgi:hypothetical protein
VQTGVDNIKSRVWTKLHHGECVGNWWEDRVAKKCFIFPGCRAMQSI